MILSYALIILYVLPETFCFVCKIGTPESNKKLMSFGHIKVGKVVISDFQGRVIFLLKSFFFEDMYYIFILLVNVCCFIKQPLENCLVSL